MTVTLTPDRFAELAEAYGGAITRWPEDVRDAAHALAAEPALAAVLAEADALDAALDRWRVAPPDALLLQRVVASRRAPLVRRVRLWWAGLGIATALAGAAAGTMAAAALPGDQPAAEETVFGALPAQDH